MGTIPASENVFPVLRFAEGAAASTPPSAEVHLYAKADGLLYWKDDAGTEYAINTEAPVAGDLAAHLADTSDAHDASAVSVADAGGHFAATDVEAALAELYAGIAGGGIAATIGDAKGDLIGFSAADTPAKIAAAAYNGHALMSDSSQSAGVAWERTALGAPLYAISPYAQAADAPTNADALAANGGTLAIPIPVVGRMNYRTLNFWSTDTTLARSAEARLYYWDPDSSTLAFVTGTDCTFSYTAAAAASRSATVSGAPVILKPGTYWAVLRNTHASNTLGVGYNSANATYWSAQTTSYTQTFGSALGSTLTPSGWTNGSKGYSIMLRANAFGQ